MKVKIVNLYNLELTPKNKRFNPHIWVEGGNMTKKSAEFHAKQIRATRDYSKVKIISVK